MAHGLELELSSGTGSLLSLAYLDTQPPATSDNDNTTTAGAASSKHGIPPGSEGKPQAGRCAQHASIWAALKTQGLRERPVTGSGLDLEPETEVTKLRMARRT
jgi:hypothetical protein